MDQLKSLLIERAIEKYQEILPAGSKTSLEECFTVEDDKLCFWFNKPKEGHTTGLIYESLVT